LGKAGQEAEDRRQKTGGRRQEAGGKERKKEGVIPNPVYMTRYALPCRDVACNVSTGSFCSLLKMGVSNPDLVSQGFPILNSQFPIPKSKKPR